MAPPRSAKPPFLPLAPPAISPASRRRTRRPPFASVSAHEHPVTPPPITTTSTSASPPGLAAASLTARPGAVSDKPGNASRGSSSQYGVVFTSAILRRSHHLL